MKALSHTKYLQIEKIASVFGVIERIRECYTFYPRGFPCIEFNKPTSIANGKYPDPDSGPCISQDTVNRRLDLAWKYMCMYNSLQDAKKKKQDTR